MPCFHPIESWRSGGQVYFYNPGGAAKPLSLPCGRCIGCRIDRSRQWAVRCVHEASLHEDNVFITLTYAPEHVPPGGTLRKEDFQKFMKRLRKAYSSTRIRFFHCGEYGSQLQRPHYHALLFGFRFPDQELWKEVRGNKVYRSPSLERIWGMGFCSIGEVNFQTAAYCARYVMKKINGPMSRDHYATVDVETGELIMKEAEYCSMSLKPGIGSEWFEKYSSDVFPDDFVVLNGKKFKTPRFYDKLFRRMAGADGLDEIKERRLEAAYEDAENQTPERLAVREKVQRARLGRLKRDFEDDSQDV